MSHLDILFTITTQLLKCRKHEELWASVLSFLTFCADIQQSMRWEMHYRRSTENFYSLIDKNALRSQVVWFEYISNSIIVGGKVLKNLFRFKMFLCHEIKEEFSEQSLLPLPYQETIMEPIFRVMDYHGDQWLFGRCEKGPNTSTVLQNLTVQINTF